MTRAARGRSASPAIGQLSTQVPVAVRYERRNCADAGEQGVSGRLAVARPVVSRPVKHFDAAIAQAITESLSDASGIDRKFGTGARKRERTVARRIGGRQPRRLASPHRCARRGAPLRASRLRVAQKKDRASAISCRFDRQARLAFGQCCQRAITHQREQCDDRDGDQHFEQGEAGCFASGDGVIAVAPVRGSRPAAPARSPAALRRRRRSRSSERQGWASR